MQPFSLKDFEFKLPPDLWDAAQDLHAAGAVRKLSEIEPKFWVAEVATDEYHVEVEVLFAATKVKGFTCECRLNTVRMKFCPHVAATLITLRHFYEKERRDREKPVIRPEKEPKKLTVPNILAQIDPQKLLEFVREYAQIDREFALALKTRFAAELPGTADFFAQLLDAVVQPCKTSKPKDLDFRRLMTTLGELEKQQIAAFEAENFPVVCQIGQQIVQKLTPLVHLLQPPRTHHLEKYLLTALRRLSAIGLRPNIAPAFEADIHDFFVEILKNDAVLPAMEAELIDFFVEKSARKGQFSEIENLILEKPDSSPFVLKLAAVCFPKIGKPHLLLKLLENQTGFAEFQQLVGLLFDRDNWETAKEIIYFYLKNKQPRLHESTILTGLLFEIAAKTGDTTTQSDHLQNQFLATGNFNFYEKLKSIAGKNWPQNLENLLSAIRNQPQTEATRHRIAKILAAENQTPVLAAYLESEGDPDLLAHHVDYFLKNAPAAFYRLAKRLLADHLREHFGRQSAEKTREFLSVLWKNRPPRPWKSLIHFWRNFGKGSRWPRKSVFFLTKEERKQLFDRISAA